MKCRYKIFLILIISILPGTWQILMGATKTWSGNSSSSFFTAGNWSGGVPDSIDNIVINANAPNNLILTQNHKVASFTINGDTMDLGGYTLTVTGTCTFNGGKITTGIIKPIGTLCHFGGGVIDSRIEANCGYFRMNGGSFLKPTIIVSTSYASSTGTGNCIFSDSLTITHSGAYYFTMGSTNNDIFNGPVTIVNSSTHEFYLATGDTSYFNNDLKINNISTGGVVFGNTGGVSYLASGKTISIGSSGFTDNYLTLKNFYQLGSTAQTLTLTGTAIVNCNNANFNGNLTVTAPGILLKNSTFNGITTLTRNGSSGNFHSDGNNVFAELSYSNTGSTGRIRMASTTPDTYLGNVTFNSSGQDVQIAYSGENFFHGNLTLNSNKVVFNTANGKVTFSGDSAQTLNGSYNFSFKKLAINKTSNHVTANTTLSVDDTLFFISGNLVTSSTNVLSMKSGSTVSGASNNSFISGPVKKLGATAFIFPVGKSNQYRGAAITAPANAMDAFTCEYFDSTQSVGMNRDTSIKFISDCNYWTILRTTGTSNVNIKLGYDTTFCSMLDSAHLVVVNWNDTLWKNLGNGGITGTKNQGWVANSTSIVKYGKFTLGYTTCQLRANSASDITICHRDSVALGGSPTAINGSIPITYTWNYSSFLSDTTTSNPVARPDSTTQFSLLITDSLGCSSRDTTTITVHPIMEVLISKVKPLCYGDDNGQISAMVTSGIGPYTFFWLPDSSSNDSIYNLPAGEYSLVVTDSNTCTQIRNNILDQPRKIRTWKSVKPASCNGMPDGSISIHTLGGTLPLQYEWLGLTDTLPFLDSLQADSYYLVITDSNNCVHSDTIVITEPNPSSIDIIIYPGDTVFEGLTFKASAILDENYNSYYQFFNNDSLIQSGGSGILFTANFSDGDTLKVVAIDSSGCRFYSMRQLTVVPLDTVLLYSNYKSYCPGRENPFLISIVDPDPGITYSWYKNDVKIDSITGPEFDETIPPNYNCTYTVRANDNSAFGIFKVTVADIEISPSSFSPYCFGEEEGEITVSARGGSGIYEYKLDSGDFISTYSWEDLPTGTHTVEVRDDTGCLSSKTIIIPEVNVETTLEE